jgi:hypothetical protein
MSGAGAGRRSAAEPVSGGGRRARPEPAAEYSQSAWPTAADERGEIDAGVPRRRRRAAEPVEEQSGGFERGPATVRDELSSSGFARPERAATGLRDEQSGGMTRPERGAAGLRDEQSGGVARPGRGAGGRRETGEEAGRRAYREQASEDGRGWAIPDEPWRGTEVPWRGPDGEYHTGQMPAMTEEALRELDTGRRPDLTIIAGKDAEVREYDSNYEGRDVAPLPAESAQAEPPRRFGQARQRQMRALPGAPYGRAENG